MVCRENKARSAMMGLVKHLQSMIGPSFNDAEMQSYIHQLKHDGDVLDEEVPLTKEAEIDFICRLRTEIERNPNISDIDKYRKSHRRPGLITRLDQEINRLKTGLDENGEELTAEQRNSHSHIYALMHLGQGLERIEPAKEVFLENYARHMGISFDAARREWNDLMNQSGKFEHLSLIHDDYHVSLAAAGIDAHTQINLGVSGRAVHAMRVMEQRRQAFLETCDQRSVAVAENSRARYMRQESARMKLKCQGAGGCGQFGHLRENCPNQKEKIRLDEERKRVKRYEAIIAIDTMALDARTLSNAEIRSKYRPSNIAAWRREAKAQQEKMVKQILVARRNLPAARREEAHAQEALDAKRLLHHEEVAEIFYNVESGTLIVRCYTTDDETITADIARRCTTKEAKAFIECINQGESLNAALSGTVGAAHNRFSNIADMKAASKLIKCPTCGQFASMNTSHQCVVAGGPSEAKEASRKRRRLEYRRQQRAAAKASGSTYSDAQRALKEVRPKKTFSSDTKDRRLNIKDENGHLISVVSKTHGAVKEVKSILDDGNVACPVVDYTFSDSVRVTGRATLWQQSVFDHNNQERVLTVASVHYTGIEDSGLKCTCADYARNYRCKHISAVQTTVVKGLYGAHLVAGNDVVPGEALNDGNTRGLDGSVRVSPDMLLMDHDHTDIDEIMAIKTMRRTTELQQYRANRAVNRGTAAVTVVGSVDAEGQPTDIPDEWTPQVTVDGGKQRSNTRYSDQTTDVTNKFAVAKRLRQVLSNISVEMPDGTKQLVSFRANCRDRPGGVAILPATKYNNAAPSVRYAVNKALAQRMGFPLSAVRSDGLFIPSDKGSFIEALERASGNVSTRRWTGPKAYIVSELQDINRTRSGATNV